MGHNARYARLAIEYTKLMNLAARSSVIEVRPIEVQPGWPPEKYIITYRCRGIASIDQNAVPRVSEFHQVSMYLGSDYPLKEPYLKWLTPIWHPNIDHDEPHHVCTNNVQNWFAAKPLAELVLAMGEMVQYKHYHAKWVSPFPLDRAAADWVLEVAEPRGLIGSNKPFDSRPLLQAQRMRNKSHDPHHVRTDMSNKRIKLGRPPAVVLGNENLAGNGGRSKGETVLLPSIVGTRSIRFGKRPDAVTTGPLGQGGEETPRRLVDPVEVDDSSAPSATEYSVEIMKDGKVQRVERVDKPLLSVGRGALGRPVDLVLEGDLTLSRLHVLIERDENGSFWLTVKGQNPVRVGGRTVPRDRSIGVDLGQPIEICSYTLKLL